ncbi:uncharacterized protein LOC120893581 [Anopheles arabiensis]|uniref:uncharacterized protein LOC120893581 n=1 Tax=Anopheles arabiensis TaxID=7173 RepID=UPI001AAD8F6E|nr:uncharacterized protein LOC120893581 [Anopheles arabiensis]
MPNRSDYNLIDFTSQKWDSEPKMSVDDQRVTKDEMLCALQSAEITVPCTATLMQIRALYKEAYPSSQQNGDSNDTMCNAAIAESKEESVTQIMKTDVIKENDEAAAEIVLLKQKCEILELRNKLAALESQSREYSNTARLLHPEEVKQIIPMFGEGASFLQWIKTVKHSAEVYGWTDQMTLMYASSQLTGAAKEWYSGFRHSVTSFKEFAEGMGKAFPDTHNEAAIHKKLLHTFKRNDESYAAYIFRVHALGTTGNVSNAAIITYIIRGLSRDPMYDNLVAKEYRDVYDLIDHVNRCEMHYQMREPPSSPTRPQPSSRFTSMLKTNTKPANGREEMVRCYNCSSFGHFSNQCRKPRQSAQLCFLCGSPDHKKQDCPNVAQRMPAAIFAPCDQQSFQHQCPASRLPQSGGNDYSHLNLSMAAAAENNYGDDNGNQVTGSGARIDPIQEP